MKRPSSLALALIVGFLLVTAAAIVSQWERRHPDPFSAAAQGQAGHLSYHLGRGLDVLSRDEEGRSLLYLALGPEGSYEAVSLLVKSGAALEEPGREESLLGRAAHENRLRDLQLLLQAGADVHQVDRLGRTALHRVQPFGVAATIVAELLEAGASLETRDASGMTAGEHLRSLGRDDVDAVVKDVAR